MVPAVGPLLAATRQKVRPLQRRLLQLRRPPRKRSDDRGIKGFGNCKHSDEKLAWRRLAVCRWKGVSGSSCKRLRLATDLRQLPGLCPPTLRQSHKETLHLTTGYRRCHRLRLVRKALPSAPLAPAEPPTGQAPSAPRRSRRAGSSIPNPSWTPPGPPEKPSSRRPPRPRPAPTGPCGRERAARSAGRARWAAPPAGPRGAGSRPPSGGTRAWRPSTGRGPARRVTQRPAPSWPWTRTGRRRRPGGSKGTRGGRGWRRGWRGRCSGGWRRGEGGL